MNRVPPNTSTKQIVANRLQSKVVDVDPLCWLEFTEESIITSCKSGKLSKRSLALGNKNNNFKDTFGHGIDHEILRAVRAIQRWRPLEESTLICSRVGS